MSTLSPKPRVCCDPELIRKNFPAELVALDYWCLWRYEWRKSKQGGEWTKVPCQPTGRKAKSDDRATWSSFDAVCDAYRGGSFDGLGCFIAAPYIGVDFDEVRNKETGTIEPWAAEAIQLLESFTEVSVSGTGLHVWVTGELPPGRRRCGRVEIYQTGRYFTVSGVLP
jgi:putative DNA primase/helicase